MWNYTYDSTGGGDNPSGADMNGGTVEILLPPGWSFGTEGNTVRTDDSDDAFTPVLLLSLPQTAMEAMIRLG